MAGQTCGVSAGCASASAVATSSVVSLPATAVTSFAPATAGHAAEKLVAATEFAAAAVAFVSVVTADGVSARVCSSARNSLGAGAGAGTARSVRATRSARIF